MKRKLQGLCVVVTGASSGIGRETALLLAGKGAKLVIAARREDPLEEVARLCRERGGECKPVPTDVSNLAEIDTLVREAIAAFGRIDVWINNAGIYVMGTVEQTPLDVFERAMKVNFLAAVAATKAVLPHFRQRNAGLFVNISSALGKVTAPYLAAYSATKHALKAFSEALRDEVRDVGVDVSVVYPTSTDTPLFEHTANYTGKEVKPSEPIYPVRDVAQAIVDCIESPKRDVVIGVTKGFSAFHTLAPSLFDRVMSSKMEKKHFKPKPQGATDGNVWTPMSRGAGSSGGWPASNPARKLAVAALALVAIPLVIGALRA
ncbi:MAG: SDR family NAD(P)-dependent oxidoreductase [Myxococcales bacterium]|nr:SDR family NAD(P)-dependent oxidoreductase [Myxococcales bacterium]